MTYLEVKTDCFIPKTVVTTDKYDTSTIHKLMESYFRCLHKDFTSYDNKAVLSQGDRALLRQ